MPLGGVGGLMLLGGVGGLMPLGGDRDMEAVDRR